MIVVITMDKNDCGGQVLSQVVGGGEETTTPFSNIFPTTTLPTLGKGTFRIKNGKKGTNVPFQRLPHLKWLKSEHLLSGYRQKGVNGTQDILMLRLEFL